MKLMHPCARPLAVCAMLALSLTVAAAADDDDTSDAAKQSALPTLNDAQQRAVGLAVAHPLAAKSPERIEALGLVLDATTLLADTGELGASRAAEIAASAELTRLRALYQGGAGASLRMLEAAQADLEKIRLQSAMAAARFALHWAPLAAMPAAEAQGILREVTSGHALLVRADIPGRHSLGELPTKAVLDVDGVSVPGRVLGTLRQSSEIQSAGLLIEVPNAPAGLGAGARLPLDLLTAQRSGLALPREAFLYDERGAYVYKQLTRKAADQNTRYAPVRVTLRLPYGDGWIADGVDDDDEIVVHGAGVLWSLQGVGAPAADDD